MAAASPRPSSPLTDLGAGTLYSLWRSVKVRTLVKYLATASISMLVLLVLLSANSQMVKGPGASQRAVFMASEEYIYSEQDMLTPTTKTLGRRELRELHARRRAAVQDVCSRNGISPGHKVLKPAKFHHIYVDDKHKFLYCSVPKVACTNFKRILLVLSGKVNTSDPMQLESQHVHGYMERYLKTLDQYTPKQIKAKLKNYYKFMFVRDPLERILSAYVNKFTTHYNKKFPLTFGTKIIKNFRRKPSKRSIQKGDDVQFEEFVRYLLDPSISEPFNEHWQQYYKLCSPCLVQYDAIGKYETMHGDVDFVLDEIGISNLVNFPKGTANNGKGKTTRKLNTYYDNISSELIHQLWELYSVDYSMFGYPYPDVKSEE